MFNAIPVTLNFLRSSFILGQIALKYAPGYKKDVYMEHELFKLGRGAGEIAEANAEAEAY